MFDWRYPLLLLIVFVSMVLSFNKENEQHAQVIQKLEIITSKIPLPPQKPKIVIKKVIKPVPPKPCCPYVKPTGTL
jgi:hypothetical protein